MARRSTNFTKEEVGTLVEEVERRRAVIFGRFDGEISHAAKKRAWEGVAQAVSSSGTYLRDVGAVKKKWADIKCQTKKEAAHQRRLAKQTGGGPPPAELDTLEEKVVALIGEEVIEGIPGGFDVHGASNCKYMFYDVQIKMYFSGSPSIVIAVTWMFVSIRYTCEQAVTIY